MGLDVVVGDERLGNAPLIDPLYQYVLKIAPYGYVWLPGKGEETREKG